MYELVEWIRPSDRVILLNIAEYGGNWIKPASIYLNVGFTQPHVQRRCRAMADRGVLDRHAEEAAYRPSELGRDWLLGKASVEELQGGGG